MRLHDLIHDGQTQPGAAFELRLEGLEDFLHQLTAHAGTGIGKVDLPVVADLLHAKRVSTPPLSWHGPRFRKNSRTLA